jgi:hypothetical protein
MIIDDNRVVKKPDDKNSKIWRYLDFPKFVSLLDKGKLFFVQACHLDDKFEGSWSKTNIELDKYLKELKQYTCISCWQKNEEESAHMWELYPRSDNGIAIQSSFNILCQSFENEKRDLYAGEVHYTNDIKSKLDNTFEPFFRKRIYHKDDHEIRVIYQEIDKGSQQGSTINSAVHGTYITVDLNKLIQNIYISPKAEKWFPNLVQSIVDKYELDIKVKPSSLGDFSENFEDKDTSEEKKVQFVPYLEMCDCSGNIYTIAGVDYITMQKPK